MSEETMPFRAAGIEADTSNLNLGASLTTEVSSTSVKARPASLPDDQPTTDSSDDEDGGVTRYPGLLNYIVGWAVSREAVMKAFKTTDARDMRVTENIHRFARDYVEPIGNWDVRLGKYIKDSDRENLEIQNETVIVADGADMPEGLEARLDEWKEFPPKLWRLHKWMKGPHVFRNLG